MPWRNNTELQNAATPRIPDSKVPKLSDLPHFSHGNLMTKQGSYKKNTQKNPKTYNLFSMKSSEIPDKDTIWIPTCKTEQIRGLLVSMGG